MVVVQGKAGGGAARRRVRNTGGVCRAGRSNKPHSGWISCQHVFPIAALPCLPPVPTPHMHRGPIQPPTWREGLRVVGLGRLAAPSGQRQRHGAGAVGADAHTVNVVALRRLVLGHRHKQGAAILRVRVRGGRVMAGGPGGTADRAREGWCGAWGLGGRCLTWVGARPGLKAKDRRGWGQGKGFGHAHDVAWACV